MYLFLGLPCEICVVDYIQAVFLVVTDTFTKYTCLNYAGKNVCFKRFVVKTTIEINGGKIRLIQPSW